MCMELRMNLRYNALIVIAVTLSDSHSDFKLPYVAGVPSPSGMPHLAIYGIYSAKPASPSTAPSKLILLNLNYYPFNWTSPWPAETVGMLFVGLLLVGKPGKTAGWLVEIRSTSKREEELLWKVIVRALLKLYDAELNFGSFLLLTGAQKSKFSRKGLSQI
jgi:uncharacterized RDD family membrane protein YckC